MWQHFLKSSIFGSQLRHTHTIHAQIHCALHNQYSTPISKFLAPIIPSSFSTRGSHFLCVSSKCKGKYSFAHSQNAVSFFHFLSTSISVLSFVCVFARRRHWFDGFFVCVVCHPNDGSIYSDRRIWTFSNIEQAHTHTHRHTQNNEQQ